MKKMIVFLLALSVLSSITLAQDVKWQKNIDAIGTYDVQSSTGVYYGPGLRYHVLSWQIVDGSISAGTIKLEKSVDVITWADLVANQTCTSNGIATIVADQGSRLRINLSAFTISTGKPYLSITYAGYWDNPTVTVTNSGTFATQTDVTKILGTAVSATNGLPVYPQTSATWAATQSGTWTVQPGNTANTTAWKVDGSAVTQPVSLATAPTTPVTGTFWQTTQPVSGTFWQTTQPVSVASIPSHDVTNAGTFAVQATSNSANIATEASLAKLIPLTGSAYSGTTSPGPMIMGSVTTAAPSYTAGTLRPLSIMENGSARFEATNLIASTAVGAVPEIPGAVSGIDSAGNKQHVSASAPGSPPTNGVGTVQGVGLMTPLETKTAPPASNYNPTNKTSNGTTTVNLVAAVTNYSIVVDAISISNSNATTGFVLNLCDGACSTANWMPIPAPAGITAQGGVSGAVIGGLNFSTAKSAQLDFVCQANCTTAIQVGVTYHLVLRP